MLISHGIMSGIQTEKSEWRQTQACSQQRNWILLDTHSQTIASKWMHGIARGFLATVFSLTVRADRTGSWPPKYIFLWSAEISRRIVWLQCLVAVAQTVAVVYLTIGGCHDDVITCFYCSVHHYDTGAVNSSNYPTSTLRDAFGRRSCWQ